MLSANGIRKILIAGNNPGVLKALTMLLEKEYTVTSVPLREPEICIARTEMFPVIILDLCVDEMAGIEMLQNQRTGNEGQQVVILTYCGGMEEDKTTTDRKAFKQLIKPFHLRELKNTLRESHELYLQRIGSQSRESLGRERR